MIPRSLAFVAPFLVALAPGPLSGQTFTLDDVLSAPFPEHLTASREGALAWVRNDRGERNIWVATPPEYRAARVTDYRGDEGQEIADLAWTADGRRLVYVRGGAPNRAGEVPHPTGVGEWPDRAVYVVGLEGASPRRLAEGAAPTPSPDGATLAYVKSGQVWTVSLAADADSAAGGRPLMTIRGSASQLRWSPDGSRLAFVSSRGDHAFVGVYDLERERVDYLAPSVDQDGDPEWSPDGNRLAFVRRPNVRRALPFEPRREGHPWSIMVSDAATGETHTAWSADPGPGSVFRGLIMRNQVLWAAGDRLVFSVGGERVDQPLRGLGRTAGTRPSSRRGRSRSSTRRCRPTGHPCSTLRTRATSIGDTSRAWTWPAALPMP